MPFKIFSVTNRIKYFSVTNRILGIFLTSIFLVLYIHVQNSKWASSITYDGFALGFLPKIFLLFCGICSIGMIFDKYRNEVPKELKELNYRAIAKSILMIIFCVIYFIFFQLIGFLIPTIIFLFTSSYVFLGARPLKLVCFSILVMSVSIYIVLVALGAI